MGFAGVDLLGDREIGKVWSTEAALLGIGDEIWGVWRGVVLLGWVDVLAEVGGEVGRGWDGDGEGDGGIWVGGSCWEELSWKFLLAGRTGDSGRRDGVS